jgi:hypothetical protein
LIEYYELTPTPAIPVASVLPGDKFPINEITHDVLHLRGNATIGTHATDWPGVNLGETPAVPVMDGFYRVVYAKEKAMPGQNVSCTGVSENQTTGAVTFRFSSGNQVEYGSWEDCGVVADAIDATPDYAEKLLVMKAFRASPDGANKTTQVGASVSVNGLADTPVVYTEPQ